MQQTPSPNPDKIKQMFSQVAQNYDRANSILSAGIHHLWRRKAVKISGAQVGNSILDCATGTGDLAIAFKKAVKHGKVIGTDFCVEMLAPAPEKARQNGVQIDFQQADVTELPFENNSFDISSISFGIRNVGNPLKGLQEMARVTKPGGCVIILEFGKMEAPLVAPIYNFYAEKVLPYVGGLLTGQREAYAYLQKSSASFPSKDNFLKLMESTGSFSHTEYHTLSGGIAYLYKGIVGTPQKKATT